MVRLRRAYLSSILLEIVLLTTFSTLVTLQFWAFAYKVLYKGRYFESKLRGAETILNVILLITGLYIFGAGTVSLSVLGLLQQRMGS